MFLLDATEIRAGAGLVFGWMFQLASRYMSRGVLYDASTVGCITYSESVSRPKLYTGLYMYNKIRHYYMYKLL